MNGELGSTLGDWLARLQETLYRWGDALQNGPAFAPTVLTVLALAVLLLALGTMAIAWVALRRANQMRDHYRTLMTGATGTRLDDALSSLIGRLEAVEDRTTTVGRHARTIDVGLESAVQQVRLVRYDATDQSGAPNSFSLALLDAHDNGIVLTAIAMRERTRVYAKPVAGGRSPHALSTHEQRALSGEAERPASG
jgi:hypothetical protein